MSKDKLTEALLLAEEILKNIELNEIPLANACLKAVRLARLLNDTQRIEGLTQIASYIGQLESHIETSKIRLTATQDPDVSISSANPNQIVWNPIGNNMERTNVQSGIVSSEKNLQDQKTAIYKYALNTYYELRFSAVPEVVFERTRVRVDKRLAEIAPSSVQKFISVFDNLKSTNSEDWSNAVHSCRRILQDVADILYPPNPKGLAEIERSGKKIQIGTDNYINRLMIYVESKSTSETFRGIVGSHLRYLGERLDAIYNAASKGTHSEIKAPEEAERYIIYTYLLLGDILWL